MSKTTTTTTTTVTTVVTDAAPKTVYDFFVLDRSGSMRSILDSTINGFNEYLNKAQRDAAANANLTSYASAILFDDEFINLYDFVPVSQVSQLTRETFVPRGMTALNDAIGKAIIALKQRLAGKEKDADVTITVFTDGEENASSEYRGVGNQALKQLVQQVQNDYKWTVAYVGAGAKEKVQQAAVSLGFMASNVTDYTANSLEAATTFSNLATARSQKTNLYATKGLQSNVGYSVDSKSINPAVDENDPSQVIPTVTLDPNNK